MSRLDDLLAANNGVLFRREHPHLQSLITRACREGQLAMVFPGVYVDAAHRDNPDLLAVAALRRFPEGVLRLHTAARKTFWPEVTPPAVQVAGVRPRHQTAGFEFTGRRVLPKWVMEQGPIRLTHPEYTAMELGPATDGESIDQLLRQRMGTVEGLHSALQAMSGCDDQQLRASLLLDSRQKAWSAAERLAHKIMRAAGITGWEGNYRLRSSGRVLYLDIAFVGIKLVIEIDGREFHTAPTAFEVERERQNFLVLQSWIVLRFTWTMLTEDPDYVVRATREAIELATETINWRR